jgi:hypothetical protein
MTGLEPVIQMDGRVKPDHGECANRVRKPASLSFPASLAREAREGNPGGNIRTDLDRWIPFPHIGRLAVDVRRG